MGKTKKTPGGKTWHDWAETPEQERIHEEKMRLAEKHGTGTYNSPDEISNTLRDFWREKENREDRPDSVLPFSRCYLTTACVDAMGLPDDCFELGILRGFRDGILLKTERGKRAVQDYGVIAPEIVQAVGETEGTGAREVWRSLYKDIVKAVNMVLAGDFEGAFKHYQKMTSRLKTGYLD